MSAIKSMAHCSNGPNAGMNSIDVPSKSESTSQRAMSSLLFAYRLGTILPNGSLCVLDHDDENPKPPASSPKRSNSCIANNSSAVASRSVAAVPITTLLRALWPTLKPALIDKSPFIESKYSEVDFQFQGTPS